jgi:phosphinothricin acetyltransferase
MLDIQIRAATAADLPPINDIYNHYVACSACTYQEEPETMDDRRAWFAEHGEAHPITVATIADEVVGWGCLSPYRARSAYRFTVENSVYVRHDVQRRGIGRLLLADLIERARAAGHHTIVAVIDAEQTGSIALHLAAGFRDGGELRELGFKFGRWLHVRYLQLML